MPNKKKKKPESPSLENSTPSTVAEERDEYAEEQAIIVTHVLLGAYPPLNVEHSLECLYDMFRNPAVYTTELEELGAKLIKVSQGSPSTRLN